MLFVTGSAATNAKIAEIRIAGVLVFAGSFMIQRQPEVISHLVDQASPLCSRNGLGLRKILRQPLQLQSMPRN